MLELVHARPNWLGALTVALVRPTGVPERRQDDDPWRPGRPDRPRRLTDDLAWLRRALDDPEPHGLQPLPDRGVIVAWMPDLTGIERLRRLRDRAVLEAAGFQLLRGRTARAACSTREADLLVPSGTAASMLSPSATPPGQGDPVGGRP